LLLYKILTFKDLKKRVSLQEETPQQQSRLFEPLRNKPFWISDINEHRHQDVAHKLTKRIVDVKFVELRKIHYNVMSYAYE
jgi:hypothetical protein